MMTMKRTAWIGAFLFCLGMGCGDGSVASDTLAVTGSGVAGGARPKEGGIILDLKRMRAIRACRWSWK